MPEKNPEVLAKLITLLDPLSDEDRSRTVRAALTFLGSDLLDLQAGSRNGPPAGPGGGDGGNGGPSQAADRWMKQNSLTGEMVEAVFHARDGAVKIIAAHVPGGSKREKAKNCYLICGVRALLATGEPRFADEEVRELCRSQGCYDNTNHSKTYANFGNQITGTAGTGFVLTSPGCRAAADVVRLLASESAGG